MKIFLASMLLFQCLLNEAKANLNGQTNARVPLLNEDGNEAGTTITCSPYSVEDETYDVEYVKYVLDAEEEENSTVVWNSHPNKTLFEQCASYAAETNAGMFYFDGDTCETCDTVYERKEKTCNSTSAKMVYMQKGLLPASPNCTEGEEWPMQLPCGVFGKKRCQNGVIISERMYDITFLSHMEEVDYIPITGGCLLKPQDEDDTGRIYLANQLLVCSYIGAVPCDPPSGVNSSAFTSEVQDFMDTSVGMIETDMLAINVFRNSTKQFNWNDSPSTPSHFPDSSLYRCLGLEQAYPHDGYTDTCNLPQSHNICCMLKESTEM